MSTSTSGISDLYSSSTSSITTSTAIQGKGTDDLTMDDFFQLLVAQMTNQDLFSSSEGSSSSNTDMISQLAQFSTLQGIQTIQEYQQSAYAMTYVGKNVTIASVNETTGKMETITGEVQSVTFYDGNPQVIVNGEAYDLHTVMEINTADNTGNTLNQTAAYIGKEVTLTDTDSDGLPFDVKGIVESVTIRGGMPYVMVGGKEYPASSITNVAAASAAASTEDESDSELDSDED